MRKLRSNSKRKWIVGGAMFFGGVGLLTTGFATWVVGTQIMNQQQNGSISVDTSINSSITLTATPNGTEKFYIGEPTTEGAKEGDVVKVDDGKPTDLSVEYSSVVIECGNEYFDKHFKNNEPFDLTLGLDESKTELANKFTAKNTVSQNLVDAAGTTTNVRSGSSWTYLNLTTITKTITPVAPEGTPAWDLKNGVHIIELTGVKFDFGWGTFFGNVSPTEFYNGHKSDFAGLSKGVAIDEELKALSAAFTGPEGATEIPLVLTLVPHTLAAE